MKKTIIFTLLAIVIGCIIGFIGAMAYCGPGVATMMFTLQEMEISEFENSAVNAYYNQPAEVAIWALEKHICTLNRVKGERSSAKVENPFFMLTPNLSLVFAHGRIANLYKKLNNPKKYKFHFDKAMAISKGNNLSAFDNEEEFIDFIHKMDSSQKTKEKSPIQLPEN